MKIYRLAVFLMLFSCVGSVAGSFRRLDVENGLSSRQVYCLSKDSTGFMWFLTQSGIDRFDGSEIRHYRLNPNKARQNTPLSRAVMLCDKKGVLWISLTNGNIFAYNKTLDNFSLKFDITNYFNETTILNRIFFDSENCLYVGLSNGFFKYDEQNDRFIPVIDNYLGNTYCIIENDSGFYIGTDSCTMFCENRNDHFDNLQQIEMPIPARIESLCYFDGKLYIGTFSNGLFIHNTKTGKTASMAYLIPPYPVQFIVPFQQNIIVGSDGAGLFVLDSETGKAVQHYISDEDNDDCISGNTVSDLTIDENNCIWISTSTNGVSILDPHKPVFTFIKHEFNNPNSLISNHINTILEDSDGDMWYGTNTGVSRYQSNINKWTHYLSSVVLSLSEDSEKNIWAGGYGTGALKINKKTGKIQKINKRQSLDDKGLTTDYLFRIRSRKNQIWFGGIEGELTCYDIKTNEYSYYAADCIGDILFANDSIIAMAGCSGLGFLNTVTKEVRWINTFAGRPLYDPIRCLKHSTTGDYWLATNGDGLIRYNAQTDSATFYVQTNGISNTINSLLEDREGRIWFSNDKSLFCLDLQTDIVSNMSDFLGAGDRNFTPNACIVKRNGDFVFGTADGALEFSPNFNHNTNTEFKLLFTDFRLAYKSVIPGIDDSPLEKAINETASLKLKYEENSFSVSFSAINLYRPQQIEYQYILEGFNNHWLIAPDNRTVSYMNLPSGQYFFRLKAIDKFTLKTIGERTLEIVIDRPFYLSTIALLLYAVFLILLALGAYQYIKNRISEHNIKEQIRFFVGIAHDIRTPISLIKAPLSEIDINENLTEHGKELLSVATKNTEKLFALVSQLLDLQRASAEIEQVEPAKQNLYEYLHEKIIDYRSLATRKGIDLLLEVSPDFPTVRFDREKMDKVLDNLLSNAVKYTEAGYVSVIAEYSRSEWTLKILDTGIGIPESDRKHLFKQFFRAGNAINSHETGYGIGLLLTKKLVSLMKGSISFVSAENRGSSFLLTFPLGNDGKPEDILPTETMDGKAEPIAESASKDVILLAEDEKDMREYLERSLSKKFHVVSVGDGLKALETAKEINPDLVILDILMPEMRGDEVCRRLKNSIETSHIPIILLSALGEKENIIQGLEAGANDYILKPFDFSILKARIKSILQNREKLRNAILSPEQQTPEEVIDYTGQLDREFLEKAQKIIEAELSNSDYSINSFCRELGMGRTSVYNKLKALTDLGPNDFIRVVRLNKARELIRQKRYTIAEVCYMTGFSDPKYFSTIFKKQFGVSPKKAFD